MNKEHIDESSAKHFLVCFTLALYSTELAVGCGIGKEVGDYKNYGHFCGWDLFLILWARPPERPYALFLYG